MAKMVNLAVKVPQAAKERLDRVRERCGFASVYDILQTIVFAFLRAADPDGEAAPLTEADERLAAFMRVFEEFPEPRRPGRPRDAAMSLRCVVGIYDVAGRRRREARTLRVGEDGGHRCVVGTPEAVSRVLRELVPQLWAASVELGTLLHLDPLMATMRAVRETLDYERDAANDEDMDEELAELSDAGAPIYGERARRVKHKSVNNEEA